MSSNNNNNNQVVDLSGFDQIQEQLNNIKNNNNTPAEKTEVLVNKNVDAETSEIAQKISSVPNAVHRKTIKYKIIEVKLPSQGKFYSKDSPCYGLETVQVRNLTAPDEDILTSPNLIRSGKAIDKLLQSVFITENINPDDLLIGDRMAILVALRINAFGNEYNPGTKIVCPHCAFEIDYTFDLNTLQVKSIKIPENAGNNFELTLPSCKSHVQVKFFTNRDENMVDEIVKGKKKVSNDGIDHSASIRLWYHIVSVDGNTDRNNINAFVEGLDVRDSRAIRKFINDSEPSLDLNKEIMCPECTGEFDQVIPITSDFFFPKL